MLFKYLPLKDWRLNYEIEKKPKNSLFAEPGKLFKKNEDTKCLEEKCIISIEEKQGKIFLEILDEDLLEI